MKMIIQRDADPESDYSGSCKPHKVILPVISRELEAKLQCEELDLLSLRTDVGWLGRSLILGMERNDDDRLI